MNLESMFTKLQNREPSVLGSEVFSKYAVLLPLLKVKGELHILFELRSLHLRRQPGEVCFPGGKMEAGDRDALHTAIRETSEELGINEADIHSFIPLDYILSPFGTIVYPFVGSIEHPDSITPNASEVGEVFTVPLSFLLKYNPIIHKINHRIEPEDDFPYDAIIGGKDYHWQPRQMEEYFYYYEDKVIWGMTARILKHFIDLLLI